LTKNVNNNTPDRLPVKAMPESPIETVRSTQEAAELLRRAGLRPTRQRLALALGLFGSAAGRHVTAEELHAEARAAGHRVSIATIYNTLHAFTQAGLLREIAIGGARRYFDTNTSNHNHFHLVRDGVLMDIEDASVSVHGLPHAPEGMRIAHVDVVVHLEPAD
jgi:Fur family iron response transcriptional regulator